MTMIPWTMSRVLRAPVLALTLVLVASAAAHAGNYGSSGNFSWGHSSKGPNVASRPNVVAGKVINYQGNFTLTVIDAFDGACPDGYANQCVSGDCGCLEFEGFGSSEIFGKAPDVIAEITVDLGDQPGDPDGTCFPGFGFVAFDGTRDSEEIDFVGAACNNFDGSSTFTGGWEFEHPSALIFDGQGPSALGSFTGPDTFALKLKGKACKGSGACL